MDSRLDFVDVTRASASKLTKLGKIVAAKIAIIAMTIKISTNVKANLLFVSLRGAKRRSNLLTKRLLRPFGDRNDMNVDNKANLFLLSSLSSRLNPASKHAD